MIELRSPYRYGGRHVLEPDVCRVYSDGTAFGGKQINGLALLISQNPDIGPRRRHRPLAQVWWRNVAVNANTDARGVVTRRISSRT
jgi:hypothetical protein